MLPGSPGCLVLVTSRRRLRGLDDACTLSLGMLPEADAMALLKAVAGTGRVLHDDTVLAEIVEQCGRLPLALRLVASLLRHRPAWRAEYVTCLMRDQQRRITAMSDGERDLNMIFGLSYRNLRDDARQRMYRYLGLVPGPDIDAYAAACLVGTDPHSAAGMLEDFIDHNLLMQHTPGRYQLHDLIRLHAQSLAHREPPDDPDAALGRLLDYYQKTACHANAVIACFRGSAPRGRALRGRALRSRARAPTGPAEPRRSLGVAAYRTS